MSAAHWLAVVALLSSTATAFAEDAPSPDAAPPAEDRGALLLLAKGLGAVLLITLFAVAVILIRWMGRVVSPAEPRPPPSDTTDIWAMGKVRDVDRITEDEGGSQKEE
jgi:Na+-transporting methylmalonyl-CoA/oxaloacetate decarboxylase gamma subunit